MWISWFEETWKLKRPAMHSKFPTGDRHLSWKVNIGKLAASNRICRKTTNLLRAKILSYKGGAVEDPRHGIDWYTDKDGSKALLSYDVSVKFTRRKNPEDLILLLSSVREFQNIWVTCQRIVPDSANFMLFRLVTSTKLTPQNRHNCYPAMFFPVHHAHSLSSNSFAVKLSTQNNQLDRSIVLALLLLLCSDVNALSLQNKRRLPLCACSWHMGVPWMICYKIIDITHAHEFSLFPCIKTQVPQNLISCI